MHLRNADAPDRREPAERRPSRRATRPALRHRRPTLLLGALVAGGVAAAVVGVGGGAPASADSTSVLAAQDALDTADEATEVLPQASITEQEAQVRLQEVAASRAARAQVEEAAQEAARPKAALPINGARLTTCFCMRWGTMHWGIDLAAPMLTPEYAAMDGVVLRAGAASGFGLAVYILHQNGDVTVYGHMEKILVGVGNYVQAGDTIALLGQRGQSTGPHLHFEVQQGGMNGKRSTRSRGCGRAGSTSDLIARVSRAAEEQNRQLLRARDVMDRSYAEPLDVPTLARIAHVSEAHFIRTFRTTFGETPNRYLQRRRVERAMWLLRATDRSVTDICMDVGFASLGTFSRVFAQIVGEPPSAYRRRGPIGPVPSCFAMAWSRPSSHGETPGRPPLG